MKQYLGLIFISIVLTTSCKVEMTEMPPIDDVKNGKYLVVGHCYQHASPHENNRIDHRLEDVNFRIYEGILLGGDICSETTKYEKTVDYLDDIFDLSNPQTLWSLGNHDARNGNLHWVTDRTQRQLYYTSYFDDIQWLVLFTPFDLNPDMPNKCDVMASQWELINTVLDTIQHASNLVVLTHYVVWGNVDKEGMNVQKYANTDKSYLSFTCDSINNFDKHIYPKLVNVIERGIPVCVISGDGGQKSKRYKYTSEEGIEFFITGINNSIDSLTRPEFNSNPDSLLELKMNQVTGVLGKEFVPITQITN